MIIMIFLQLQSKACLHLNLLENESTFNPNRSLLLDMMESGQPMNFFVLKVIVVFVFINTNQGAIMNLIQYLYLQLCRHKMFW